MTTLMRTIGHWADGQNWWQAQSPAAQAAAAPVVEAATARLRRYTSLHELAGAYYEDSRWFTLLADEFAVADSERELLRQAAYWRRFMAIRHAGRPQNATR